MKKIKKIITAIGTNELNKKIRERKIYEVIGNDIPYQDGVLDILKGNSEINILILSETIPGEYEIKNFIIEIKKTNPYIELIVFIKEENQELKNFFIRNGINKIYIDGENTLEEILNDIYFINNETNLNLEIEKLREIIKEKTIENNSKKLVSKNIKKENYLKISKSIAITGYFGSGKSLFTVLFAKAANKLNLKTLIIDFDILNNSISTLFNISKYNKSKFYDNLEQYIVKINNNISIFTGIDILFNEENKINFDKIKEMINKFKEKYNLILFDTSSEINLKYVKTSLVNVQKIIFLIEPNLIELKKSKELLEVYLEDWEIPRYKFNIVLNKVNVNSIDTEIISNIFSQIKIIGKINFSKNYTALANNTNFKFINLKDYEKIIRKI